jgi:uncharacterized protein YbjT (DUF2867 family)
MTNDNSTVLVTGATGQQGGAVARELLANRYSVRAMTRNAKGERAQALAALGADVVSGDFDDLGSLERALDGVWGAFSVQNTWEAGVEQEEEQGKRFAELCAHAGIGHFVYTSVGSADRRTGIPHFDNKWRIEERVGELGLPSYTIIRPVFFMDNLLSPWFKPGIDVGKLMMGVQPDTVVQMIAVEDIGRYGRLAFERHGELEGRAIDIAGDELTIPEAATIISEAAGREVVFEQVPIEQVRQFSDDFATMLEWFDAVGYNADIGGNIERFGIRTVTFAEWAAAADWG